MDVTAPLNARQGASQTGFCKCLQPHLSESSFGDGSLQLPQRQSLGDLVLPTSLLLLLWLFPHPFSRRCSAWQWGPSRAATLLDSDPCFDHRTEIWALDLAVFYLNDGVIAVDIAAVGAAITHSRARGGELMERRPIRSAGFKL